MGATGPRPLERIGARVPPEVFETLHRAALLAGTTLNGFALVTKLRSVTPSPKLCFPNPAASLSLTQRREAGAAHHGLPSWSLVTRKSRSDSSHGETRPRLRPDDDNTWVTYNP